MLIQTQLVSLLDEVLTQTAKLRKGGNQATYFCPSCHHHKRKLEVNLETGQWHCWTCDIKGSYLGSLLTKVKAPRKYREQLHKLTGDIRFLRRTKKKAETDISLPEEFHPLSVPLDTPEYKNALYYLKKRKLLSEDILRYNIGYCESGPYEGHVIIPSYDSDGKLNFFIARRYYDIDGTISYKKPDVSMNLVGFESFINYSAEYGLTLVEGAFDAIAVRNNAIPLFGKYMSQKLKTAIIVNKVKRVNIILDNDAYSDAIKNWKQIQQFKVSGCDIKVHVIKLDGKDPSVLGYEKVHELIKNSKPFEDEDELAYKIGL